jgi:hypothetical protein
LSSEQSGFAAFREKVFADEDLQERLRGVADRAQFVAAVIRAGAESGCHFSAADVLSAMRLGQVAWLASWLPIL